MKKYQVRMMLAVTIVVVLFFGVRTAVMSMPFKFNSIPQNVFDSVSKCAHTQQMLYEYIKAQYDKKAKLPDDPDGILCTLFNEQRVGSKLTNCPLSTENKSIPYIIHPAAYGDPNAVFIEDRTDKHPITLGLWYRGVHPKVQTMGDGTVWMFKDGKIATIPAKQ